MANDEKKQKKNNRFFKDFKAELKKVIWPTPKDLINKTIAVITIVLILAVVVFFLDVVFEALNTYGIDKIRSAVTSSSITNETTEKATNETTEDNTAVVENSDEQTNNETTQNENLNNETAE